MTITHAHTPASLHATHIRAHTHAERERGREGEGWIGIGVGRETTRTHVTQGTRADTCLHVPKHTPTLPVNCFFFL